MSLHKSGCAESSKETFYVSGSCLEIFLDEIDLLSYLLKIPFLMCMLNDSSEFVKKLQKSHSILTVENLSPSSPHISNFS